MGAREDDPPPPRPLLPKIDSCMPLRGLLLLLAPPASLREEPRLPSCAPFRGCCCCCCWNREVLGL